MPSLFSALARVAGATVDAVFSEGFLFLPQGPPSPAEGRALDVNARLQASGQRVEVAFSGTWVAPGETTNAHGRAKADSNTQLIAGERPSIDIAVEALPQRPREGDRVQRLDTREIFEIAKVLAVDTGRLRLYVIDALRRVSEPR